ncbi:hypothetical protein SO802_021423 [Lithocarpus litseifolius]|uniref:Uncharacterized protein n=1 Tax=Lithocarpus litseifolius TaxID=425828 RepID=A0AAW2CH95_9ROSI
MKIGGEEEQKEIGKKKKKIGGEEEQIGKIAILPLMLGDFMQGFASKKPSPPPPAFDSSVQGYPGQSSENASSVIDPPPSSEPPLDAPNSFGPCLLVSRKKQSAKKSFQLASSSHQLPFRPRFTPTKHGKPAPPIASNVSMDSDTDPPSGSGKEKRTLKLPHTSTSFQFNNKVPALPTNPSLSSYALGNLDQQSCSELSESMINNIRWNPLIIYDWMNKKLMNA